MKRRWPAFVSLLLVIIITIVGCAATADGEPIVIGAEPHLGKEVYVVQPESQAAPMDTPLMGGGTTSGGEEMTRAESMPQEDGMDTSVIGGGGGGAQNWDSSAIVDEMGGYTPDLQVREKKLTYSYYLELETKLFEEDNDKIRTLAEKYDAYIESANRYEGGLIEEYNYRNTHFSFRVPADKAASFVEELSSQFHVRSSNQDVQDITQSYYDTETWLKTLEAQYTRMETLLEKADRLEDIIVIESKMSQLQMDLNNAYNAMQYQEKQVAYSWVNVNLNEVIQTTPQGRGVGFGDRLASAFKNSWSNFVYFLQSLVVGILGYLPFILTIGAIIAILIAVLGKRRKKALDALLKDTDKPEAPKEEEQGN